MLRTEQTDATQAYHRGKQRLQPLGDFCDFAAKTGFQRHFNHTGCLKSKYTL